MHACRQQSRDQQQLHASHPDRLLTAHHPHPDHACTLRTDARFCESEFARLTANMSSLVAVRTEYIAYPNADGSVGCMHGAGECAGNLQQLCLGQHVPADKNAAWFVPALLCHGNGDVSDVGHMKGCMDKAGVTADVQAKVTACIAGPEGKQLSLKSAQEVAARGVKKSCTVYIGGKRRCIRDGGRYYDCPGGSSDAEFVASICAAAGAGVTHPACQPAAAAKAGKRLRRRL